MSENPNRRRAELVKPDEAFYKYLSYCIQIETAPLRLELFPVQPYRGLALAIEEMREQHLKITLDELHIIAKEKGSTFSFSDVENIATSYTDFSNIDIVEKVIHDNYIKNHEINQVVNDVVLSLNAGGSLDMPLVQSLGEKILDISASLSTNIRLYDTHDFIEDHAREIIDRQNPDSRKSTGIPAIDKRLAKPGMAGTYDLWFGMSGSGKTALMLEIIYGLLDLGIPNLLVPLEMPATSYADRMVIGMENVSMRDLNRLDMTDTTLEAVARVHKYISSHDTLKYTKVSSLSLDQLDMIIGKAQDDFYRKGVLGSDGYMNIILDLGTMVKEFSIARTPKEGEAAVNRLHEILHSRKVHCAFVSQANENEFRGNKNFAIESIEAAMNFRLGQQGVKNNSAMYERARVVFELTRPKRLLEKFSKKDPKDWESVDDLVRVWNHKQNEGAENWVEDFVFQNFRFWPYDSMKELRDGFRNRAAASPSIVNGDGMEMNYGERTEEL